MTSVGTLQFFFFHMQNEQKHSRPRTILDLDNCDTCSKLSALVQHPLVFWLLHSLWGEGCLGDPGKCPLKTLQITRQVPITWTFPINWAQVCFQWFCVPFTQTFLSLRTMDSCFRGVWMKPEFLRSMSWYVCGVLHCVMMSGNEGVGILWAGACLGTLANISVSLHRHMPNNLSHHPYYNQYTPTVNLRLLAVEINFYFSLNCYKALALFFFVKTQRPTVRLHPTFSIFSNLCRDRMPKAAHIYSIKKVILEMMVCTNGCDY